MKAYIFIIGFAALYMIGVLAEAIGRTPA